MPGKMEMARRKYIRPIGGKNYENTFRMGYGTLKALAIVAFHIKRKFGLDKQNVVFHSFPGYYN